MSVEGQVDLNALIMQDRQKAKSKKTHQIKKDREERDQRRQENNEGRKKFEQRRSNNGHKHQNRDRSREKIKRNTHNNYSEFDTQVFAILVHGFVPDVSIDDICNLTQQRKILSIKTSLRRKDKGPLDLKADKQMEVTIIFAEKQEANSFIKEYSEKVLDGERSLRFTFVTPSLD